MEAVRQEVGEAALKPSDRYRRSGFMRLALICAGVFFAASVLFTLAYRYDNKYTAPGVQPSGGVLKLSDRDLQENPKTFLILDWEIYRGRLLSPEDFVETPLTPDELTFIGQYGGFEGGNPEASPHGSATYRLKIVLPQETRSYTLELPEIYSAYRLYVNGVLMKQMGEPEWADYRAYTGNNSVTIQASGMLDILLAVSDYGYFYSGMVYPPAFGEPDAISSYLNLRYGIRTAVLAAALCIGLISLGIRFLAKSFRDGKEDRDLIFLYALLCFCFAGFIGYPVVKTLFPGGLQWYYFENFCYSAIFLLVGLIQYRISRFGGRFAAAFVVFGLFVCFCSLLVPFFLSENLALLLTYSGLLKVYTYASTLFLTVSTAYGMYRGTTSSTLMTAGMIVFDCALVFDRIFPDFEPILFGWFNEIAAGVLVVFVGVLMAGHVARQYRLRLILEEQVTHAAHMLELQSAYYPVLLEKEREAKMARHDLRHHFLMLRELAARGDTNALTSYLEEYDLAYLQPGDTSYCKHYVVDMLVRMYAQKAKQENIRFTININVPESIPAENVDLCVIISNLLENAMEACKQLPEEERWIHLGLIYKMSRLSIAVDNSFDGWIHMAEDSFLSRKRKNTAGVGLISVKVASEKYQGSTHFYPDAEKRKFHSEVLLTARQSEAQCDAVAMS